MDQGQNGTHHINAIFNGLNLSKLHWHARLEKHCTWSTNPQQKEHGYLEKIRPGLPQFTAIVQVYTNLNLQIYDKFRMKILKLILRRN